MLQKIYGSFRRTLIESQTNYENQYKLCNAFIKKAPVNESDYHTLYHIERNFRADLASLLEESKRIEKQYSSCMDDLKKLMIEQDCQAFDRIIQESWNRPDSD